MARLHTIGAEGGHAHVDGLTSAIAGTGTVSVTSVAGNARSGTYVYNAASGASNGSASYSLVFTQTLGRSYYARVYFKFLALPTANTTFLRFRQSTNNQYGVRITTGGKIQLVFNTTQIGSDSAATVATNTWYMAELRQKIGSGSGDDEGELRLDGILVASETAATRATVVGTELLMGFVAGETPGNSITLRVDDIAINDDQGADQNTFPGSGSVVHLIPTSDSVRDALWTGGAGGTTNLFNAVDNRPPIGTATETDLTQIEHAGGAAGTTDDYEANMTTYTAAGVGTNDTVTLVAPLMIHGEDIATNAKLLSMQILTNPTGTNSGSITAGLVDGALGTYPAGWAVSYGPYTYNPTVTKGTAPTMQVRRPETATRVASVAYMAIVVEYAPPIELGAAVFDAASNMIVDSTADVPAAAVLSAAGNLIGVGVETLNALAALSAHGDLTTAGSVILAPAERGEAYFLSQANLEVDGYLVPDARLYWAEIQIPAGAPTGDELGAALFTAVASLTGVGATNLSGVSALSAHGDLVSVGSKGMVGDSLFSAQGSLASVGIRNFVGATALSAQGDLLSSAVRNLAALSALDSVSSLTASGIRNFVAASALDGQSNLAVTSIANYVASAAFTGVSDLAALGHVGGTQLADAAFSAASTLLANAVRTLTTDAVLSAATTLTTDGIRNFTGATAFSSVTNLTAASTAVRDALAALSAVSNAQIVSAALREASTTLTGVGSLTPAPHLTRGGASALSAEGVLVSAAVRTLTTAAAFAAVSDMLVAQQGQQLGSVNFSSQGILTPSATLLLQAASALAAASSLVTDGTRNLVGSTGFDAHGALSLATATTRGASAILSAEALATILATRIVDVSAAFDSQSSIQTLVNVIRNASGTYTAHTAMSGAGQLDATGAVLLDASGLLNVSADRDLGGLVSLSALADMDAFAAIGYAAQALLEANGDLTAESFIVKFIAATDYYFNQRDVLQWYIPIKARPWINERNVQPFFILVDHISGDR